MGTLLGTNPLFPDHVVYPVSTRQSIARAWLDRDMYCQMLAKLLSLPMFSYRPTAQRHLSA